MSNLYIVTDRDRWGFSLTLVRACNTEHAKSLVCPESRNCDIEPVPDDGKHKILWAHDESPDSCE